MFLQRQKNEERKFELVHDKKEKDEIFGEINTYIKSIFETLWVQPKMVGNILLNANNKDIKDHLAHFFTNNFYENILSNKNKEEQLLYIITFLLKKEINNLNLDDIINYIKNIDSKFLNETPCGYIFEEFKYKKDIKSFFKIIIIDLIEKLEISYPSQEIVFNPGHIKDNIILSEKEEEKEKNNIIYSSNILEKKYKTELDLFNQKYQFGLPKEELENKLKEKDIQDNENMINFINKKILECSDNPFLFSTEVLLENINFTKTKNFMNEQYNDDDRKNLSQNIYTIYKQSFIQTINIIDKLFENLISNIHLMPYSIKCINKIIFILINKKYPNLSTFEKNIFISKFFFNKLFFPIFINPSVSALINDFIISDNTLFNITIIISIINKFISGQFYRDIKEEGNFTPFNWYFLNKMPILFEFFEKSMKVKLPGYIEKIIDKEENDYDYNNEFDYFKENKDEIAFMKNICFSFNDFYYLYENMKNNKDKIFQIKNKNTLKIEKAIEKLYKNEYKIDSIKRKLEGLSSNDNLLTGVKNIKKSKTVGCDADTKQKLKYFFFSDIIFNNKYSDLFEIKERKEYFQIKKLKNPNNEEIENNIIKLKNFIFALLYNFQSLDKIDFYIDNGNEPNTLNILQKMKTYVKPSDLLNDEKIPSKWYIDSIIQYLKKIPQNLIEDDYSELFNQLEEDINNAIKLHNVEEISLLIDKTKLVQKYNIYYDKAKKIMRDIDLNQYAQKILEKEQIPVEIKFSYSDEEKKFDILPCIHHTMVKEKFNFFKNLFYSSQKQTCQTIKQFTNIFPDLTEYDNLQDLNVLNILEELEIPKKLIKYFDYIGESIKKFDIGDEKKFNDIKEKIYDYVMEKIYDKIYPNDQVKEDLIIFRNCVKCSWVEIKNFIKNKNNYIFENFIPDIIKNFEQINIEKSPRKKFKAVDKIFTCLFNLASLNGDKIDGTDDSLPILNYAFIKARPLSIYSNCRFMKLFLGDKKNKAEDHQLSQLMGICNQITNFSAKSLFDVTQEEFDNNCLIALKQDIN